MSTFDDEVNAALGGEDGADFDSEVAAALGPVDHQKPITPERRAELQQTIDAAADSPERAKIAILETLLGATDTARGFARGMTAHGSELAIKGAQAVAPGMFGEETFDDVRERSPVLATAGDVVGSAVSPLGRVFGGAKGAAGLIKQGASNGLVQGGLEAASDAIARGELSEEDLLTLGASVAGGGIGEPLGAAAAAGGKLIGKGLGKAATAGKNFVAGANTSVAKGLAQKYGLEGADQILGQQLEALAPPRAFGIGRSAKEQLKQFVEPKIVQEGADMRQLQNMIGAEYGTPDAIDTLNSNLLSRVDAEAARLGEGGVNPLQSEALQASHLARVRDAILQKQGPYISDFGDAISKKSAFQADAHSAAGGAVPDKPLAEADAFVGDVLRDETLQIVDQAPSNIAQSYRDNADRFSKLALLRDAIAAKTSAESTMGDIGSIAAGTVGSMGLGAAAGAAAGGEDGGIYGATLGAGAAVGGALFNGATRSAVRQLGSAVSDTGANWLRMASNAAPNVGASVGGGLSRLGGLAAGGVGSQTHTKPRGHTQTDRVSQLLHLDPQGLGQYQQVLAQAQQEGRLQQEVNKLAEVDADFRRMLSQ
jgi:hypothetical protein